MECQRASKTAAERASTCQSSIPFLKRKQSQEPGETMITKRIVRVGEDFPSYRLILCFFCNAGYRPQLSRDYRITQM